MTISNSHLHCHFQKSEFTYPKIRIHTYTVTACQAGNPIFSMHIEHIESKESHLTESIVWHSIISVSAPLIRYLVTSTRARGFRTRFSALFRTSFLMTRTRSYLQRCAGLVLRIRGDVHPRRQIGDLILQRQRHLLQLHGG